MAPKIVPNIIQNHYFSQPCPKIGFGMQHAPPFGSTWLPLGSLLASFGLLCGSLRSPLGSLWPPSGASWLPFGWFWHPLGSIWCNLVSCFVAPDWILISRSILGSMPHFLGAIFAPFGFMLGASFGFRLALFRLRSAGCWLHPWAIPSDFKIQYFLKGFDARLVLIRCSFPRRRSIFAFSAICLVSISVSIYLPFFFYQYIYRPYTH